jgi:Flp pilus assembly protein TadD
VTEESERTARAHFTKGRDLTELARFEEAVRCFEAAAALAPEDADIQAGLGKALDGAGRLEEARRRYGKALELDPGLIGPLLLRAVASQRLNDFEGALEDIEAYLAVRPDSADALVVRGCCHLAAGRKDRARADFERAVTLDPSERRRVERLSDGLL